MSFSEALGRQLDSVAAMTRVTPYRSAADSARGVKARLGYILSPKTGASVEAVAKAAGVSTRTVRSWQKGGTPSKASKQKIDQVYQKFFGINVRNRKQSKAGRVLDQVRRNALQLENDRGDDRYWKPAARWGAFVDAWADDDWDDMDAIYDGVVDDWDYGEAWGAGVTASVSIA